MCYQEHAIFQPPASKNLSTQCILYIYIYIYHNHTFRYQLVKNLLIVQCLSYIQHMVMQFKWTHIIGPFSLHPLFLLILHHPPSYPSLLFLISLFILLLILYLHVYILYLLFIRTVYDLSKSVDDLMLLEQESNSLNMIIFLSRNPQVSLIY